MVRDCGVIRKLFAVSLVVALCALPVMAGKKHDEAKIAISNVRALVVNMQLQIGALERLIEESSPTVEPASADTTASYASQRNGRLTDLRHKARLLENETSQLQRKLQEKGATDVMKLSRALYQETRTLRATIERFPRSPQAAVDNVLVAELREEVATLDQHTREMMASYPGKS